MKLRAVCCRVGVTSRMKRWLIIARKFTVVSAAEAGRSSRMRIEPWHRRRLLEMTVGARFPLPSPPSHLTPFPPSPLRYRHPPLSSLPSFVRPLILCPLPSLPQGRLSPQRRGRRLPPPVWSGGWSPQITRT